MIILPKGPSRRVTMKVSGRILDSGNARGAVSLTQSHCTTRDTKWTASPVPPKS
jgi:hypothetical protein